MQKRKLHVWACACVLLLAVLLTGCQAVQGLDIGQVLVNSATHKSSESQGSLQIEFVPAEDSDWGDNQPLAELFKQIKVDIHSVKTEDLEHVSIDADLIYSKGKIPFQLSLAGDSYTLNVQGAKKPIVIKMTEAPTGAAAQVLTAELEATLRSKYAEMMPSIYKLFTDHAPNPAEISVSSVTDQVHGETMGLRKLHAEVKGTELVGLFKGFLTSLLADEQGMKAFIGEFYDAFMPVFKEVFNNNTQMEDSLSTYAANPFVSDGMQLVQEYLDNKTLMVEFLYTTAHHFLQKAVDQIDTLVTDGLEAKGYDVLLTDRTYLKLDLYIDGDKQIRKEQFEAQVPLNEENGLSAIKLSGSLDIWNIGKPVKADTIDVSKGALTIQTGDGSSLNGYDVLNNFDKDSDLYKLLKEDFHLGKKEFYLFIENEASYEYDGSHPYVNEDEVSMVSARDIAERLGGSAAWDETTRRVLIHDDWTATDIELTIGSRYALVNGEEVALDSPAVVKNGTTFVPLRFIAEALGAKVEWDSDVQMVTVTRD